MLKKDKIKSKNKSYFKYLLNIFSITYKFRYKNIFFYIQKSFFFNKGRYSRNRQTYRTGVYLCLYINIIAVLFLYFYFYGFLIKFTYLYLLFLMSILVLVFPNFFKRRLLNIKRTFKNINTYGKIIKNTIKDFLSFYIKLIFIKDTMVKINDFYDLYFFVKDVMIRFWVSKQKNYFFPTDKWYINRNMTFYEKRLISNIYKKYYNYKRKYKTSSHSWLLRMYMDPSNVDKTSTFSKDSLKINLKI